MRTIPAREVKRRGIGAVDDMIEEGPVHVIRNDRPVYVVMTEEQYLELVDARHEVEIAGIREALADVEAGRVRRVTASQLIDESGPDRDD